MTRALPARPDPDDLLDLDKEPKVIDLLHNLIGEAQDLVTAAVVLVAIVMVVSTWARTRAFVPTIGALLFGALVVWGVRNIDFFEERIGEDIVDESGAPAAPAQPGAVVVRQLDA